MTHFLFLFFSDQPHAHDKELTLKRSSSHEQEADIEVGAKAADDLKSKAIFFLFNTSSKYSEVETLQPERTIFGDCVFILSIFTIPSITLR